MYVKVTGLAGYWLRVNGLHAGPDEGVKGHVVETGPTGKWLGQQANGWVPAYGSLYFRRSISKESERILPDPSLDPAALFCVGPECGPT